MLMLLILLLLLQLLHLLHLLHLDLLNKSLSLLHLFLLLRDFVLTHSSREPILFLVVLDLGHFGAHLVTGIDLLLEVFVLRDLRRGRLTNVPEDLDGDAKNHKEGDEPRQHDRRARAVAVADEARRALVRSGHGRGRRGCAAVGRGLRHGDRRRAGGDDACVLDRERNKHGRVGRHLQLAHSAGHPACNAATAAAGADPQCRIERRGDLLPADLRNTETDRDRLARRVGRVDGDGLDTDVARGHVEVVREVGADLVDDFAALRGGVEAGRDLRRVGLGEHADDRASEELLEAGRVGRAGRIEGGGDEVGCDDEVEAVVGMIRGERRGDGGRAAAWWNVVGRCGCCRS
jgi:hypothetical protein